MEDVNGFYVGWNCSRPGTDRRRFVEATDTMNQVFAIVRKVQDAALITADGARLLTPQSESLETPF